MPHPRLIVGMFLALLLGWREGAAQLAQPGQLLLEEDFRRLEHYTKEAQPLAEGWRLKVWHGTWTRSSDGVRSSWEKGHNPVLVLEGAVGDAIIEVDFRYRAEPGRNAYLRVGPMARELDPRAYTVSAWANVDSRARPPGVVLEHEEWRTQGYTAVATRLARFEPDTWYTLRLEMVGDQALVECNGVRASGRLEKFALPKAMIALGVGHATHELRRLRISAATLNPSWRPPSAKEQPFVAIEDIPGRGPLRPETVARIGAMTPLFDGHSLAGWQQAPPAPTFCGRDDLVDAAALARLLQTPTGPVATWLAARAAALGAGTALPAATGESRALAGALVRVLNAAIADGTDFAAAAAAAGVAQRAETQAAWAAYPKNEYERQRAGRLLLEDALPGLLVRRPATGWEARAGVLASTGAGRGVLYTTRDYTSYRLVFQVRQTAGNHFPGVLIFGTRPPPGELGLDALGGIQLAVPSAGHWDYRPGINRSGDHFHRPWRVRFQLAEWSQVEVLVDGRTGRARLAVAQPVGTRALEVLTFHDPAAARPGPIALQMHNPGLFDEYRDLRIEENPRDPDRLLTLD